MVTFNGGFLGKKITGVQRYAIEILKAFDCLIDSSKADASKKHIVVSPESASKWTYFKCIDAIYTKKVQGVVWSQLLLPFYVRGILVNLENLGAVLLRRQIVCVHDLNTVLAPDSYTLPFRIFYKIMVPLSVYRSLAVATVSSFSAKTLVEAGYCSADKITVIPNGHEHVLLWDRTKSQFFKEETIPRRFIFALGSRARHKNIEILKDIAGELDLLGYDLLVAGPRDGPFASVDNVSAPNVRILGFVTDNDLAALYSRAFCFVFPSLMEGFGLPALEAMALGCPVVASDAASIPEVCGSAALYADPRQPAAWLSQIKHLDKNPELRETMIAAGQQQAQLFSWTKSASLLRDLIEKHDTA